VVRGELTPDFEQAPVRIRVAIGSVVGVVGEVERPIFRVVGVTHTGRVAYEVLVVVSFDDRVRRFSC
jgi:hypothetical protein